MSDVIGLYLYKGEYKRGEDGRYLVELAAGDFLCSYCGGLDEEHAVSQGDAKNSASGQEDRCTTDVETVNRFEIQVDEFGKPYFTNLPLHFSISHSGEYWICAVSEMPCGIDIQERKKNRRIESIAKRFYTPEESEYVQEFGETAFYKIWTIKEAVGKLFGRGFFSPMSSLVDEEGNLLRATKLGGEIAYNFSIEISDDVLCALATYEWLPRIEKRDVALLESKRNLFGEV